MKTNDDFVTKGVLIEDEKDEFESLWFRGRNKKKHVDKKGMRKLIMNENGNLSRKDKKMWRNTLKWY